ncbi:MAG: hypothetical protein OEM26_09605 [Saprospiraceae bacterium]|nr:hypothetical protein [Saprospiraceae bacterium]
MKTDIRGMSPQSRVWVYQSSTPIAEPDLGKIKVRIGEFVDTWAAHQQPLSAWGDVLHQRFILLVVDGTFNAPSGCSIDESVAFIRSIEQEFGLTLFDRMTFSYQQDGEVFTVPRQDFQRLYREGKINDETLVFDNLVASKHDFENAWLKPISESWHVRFV